MCWTQWPTQVLRISVALLLFWASDAVRDSVRDSLAGVLKDAEGADTMTHTSMTFESVLQAKRQQAKSAQNSILSSLLDSAQGNPDWKKFLEMVDRHMVSLKDTWNDACTTVYADPPSPRIPLKYIYHTGNFIANNALGTWHSAVEKLRLSVISALSTQPSAEIWYWVDVDPQSEPFRSAMAPILQRPDLAHRLRIKRFDPWLEFSKAVGPHAAKRLVSMYSDVSMLASRSDLLRMALLHSYGGLWADGDVLMVHDMSPLLGRDDWAYLGQNEFINNAILWVSQPRSAFIRAYMAAAVQKAGVDSNVYQFGPSMLGDLRRDVATGRYFHILPTCFFDGAWSGVQNATGWDDFFSTEASSDEVAYLNPGLNAVTPFAYHWHGRWDRQMASNSAAGQLYQIHAQRLHLTLTLA
jgi:hypothetical protein